MRRGAIWSTVVVVALLIASGPAARAAPAAAGNDAGRLAAEATAAFGAKRYGDAGQKYEAAFALRPDAGLLYNAAQAHRLAGNKARALELYRGYVRLYPDGANAQAASGHAATLAKLVEAERATAAEASPAKAPDAPAPGASPAPPETAAAAAAPPATVAPLAPAPPPASPIVRVPLVARPAPAPAEEKRSLVHQTWFWVAVGAAVAVVGTTVILLASRGESFPDATFGTARGN